MTGHAALNSEKHIRTGKDHTMQVRIISFTDKGYALGNKIAAAVRDHQAEIVPRGTPLSTVCAAAFENREAGVNIKHEILSSKFLSGGMEVFMH